MNLKKLYAAIFAISLVSVSTATAAEFRFTGTLHIGAEYVRNTGLSKAVENTFGAMQRFRPVLTAAINENLYASLGLEIGTSYWGDPTGFARIGSDNTTLKIKSAFIDWNMPGLTNMNIRMGVQWIASPSSTNNGSPVLGDDVPGIVVKYAVTEHVGLGVTWARPFVPVGVGVSITDGILGHNPESSGNDAMDYFQFDIPINFAGFQFQPWGSLLNISQATAQALAHSRPSGAMDPNIPGQTLSLLNKVETGLLNQNTAVGGNNQYLTKDAAVVWWVGLSSKITAVENLTIAFDVIYGQTEYNQNNDPITNTAGNNPNRAGYYAAINLNYQLSMFTAGIKYWYTSGNDENSRTAGGHIMPSIASSYTPIMFAYDDSFITIGSCDVLGGVYTNSSQGVVLEASNITFIKNLTHLLQVGYITGTTKDGYLTHNGASTSFDPNVLTQSDQMLVVAFGTTYAIYENLTTTFGISYIHALTRNDKWSDLNTLADDALAVSMGFAYTF